MTRRTRTARIALVLLIGLASTASDCFFGDPGDSADTTPAAISILRGNGQSGPAGQALPDSLVVKVSNQAASGLAEIKVVFTVTEGGGSVSRDTVTTGQNGEASTVWTLGSTGAQSIEVRATTGTAAAVHFTATLTP